MIAASTSNPNHLKIIRIGITFLVLCSPELSRSQVPPFQGGAPHRIADSFCHHDADGGRLSEFGAKEIAKPFLVTERPWEQPLEIVIVGDYSVRLVTARTRVSEFAADYRVLGRLDSALAFTRMQMPYSNQPLTRSERLSLVLTDTHSEIGPDGRQIQVKGSLEWRIKSYPLQPHVSLNAAIAYVRRMDYRARDARAKMNAERTLSELQEMLAPSAASHQISGPDAIAAQFVEMQMGGLGLESETAGQLKMFLVNPETQNNQIVRVARAYAMKKTVIAVNKATVSVEYAALGELDSQLRLKNIDERGAIVQQDYKLLLDNKYHVDAVGDHPAGEFVGPSRWRINETPPVQWISVNAAIQYVTRMRDSTPDPSIKANADKTLAILAQYR